MDFDMVKTYRSTHFLLTFPQSIKKIAMTRKYKLDFFFLQNLNTDQSQVLL